MEDEIDAVFETILQFPRAAPQWKDRRDRRVAVLDRFPFTLFYQIKADDIVIPGACAHEPAAGLLVASALTRVYL